MTHHTEAEQPEALRVAAWLITAPQSTTIGDMLIAGRELRRLHARVQELEAAQAQRAPLSDTQIAAIHEEHGCDSVNPIDFAREIERAHGIGSSHGQ